MPKHRLFFSDDYTAASYEFDSTRKPRWIMESLTEQPIDGVQVVAPASVSEAKICELHDSEYVTAIRTGEPRALAESNCFGWDPSIWSMVTAQNGGAIAAAFAAVEDGVSGSLSTGMHHAYRDRGKGFCTFNGLALAAHEVIRQKGGNVLILDLDAHCGGGTHSLIRDHSQIWQIDISVSNFDDHGDTERSQVHIYKSPGLYLDFLKERLAGVADIPFVVCLYFSGMDPHEDCAFGGAAGFTEAVLREREEIVFGWCREKGVPIAYFVGGGYAGNKLSRSRLVDLHRMTISAGAGSLG